MQLASNEVAVYYTITLAAHVSLTEGRVTRVVELREEIHVSADDPPMLVTDTGISVCDAQSAELARSIAENSAWPAEWEFGY